MRAVWCVMKASCADRVEQKIEWLHRLEWLLVRLNPMESNHPTRHALLEARVLELCLGCLRDNQDDAGLCVSALAILVHMSLNDETSKKLASSHGLEDIAILLKKYYRRCQEREPAQPQAAQSGCPEQGETSDGSDPKGSSSPAGDSDATGASAKGLAPAQNTEVGAAGGPKEEREQASDDNKKSDSAGASMTENLQTDEGQLLAVELVTLVWRLIFATSLDGDEYAQKWIKAGAAEPAIDSVASDLDVFCSATYVCWVFGALRFLPLDNAELCEDFVRRRQLFQWTLKKMEMHHEEPLVLENGFAVLANYQRAQPAHAEILSKLPDVWTKCLSWLNTDKMMRVPDVVYQGLYTVGLACSYCPEACANLRDAKGIEFADKVVEAYGENMNSEVSSASSAWTEGTGGSSNDKYANVLQFAEGLRRLLQPVPLSAADIAAICQEPIQEADEEDSDEEKRNASRELDQGPRSEATAVKSDACHQDPAAAQDCVGPQSPTSPTPVETVENTECVVDRLTDGNTEHNIQSTKSSEMIPLPILTLRTRSVTHDSDGMSAEKVTPELLSLPVSEAGQGTPEGTLPALTPDEGQSPARASPGLTSFANAKATPIVSVEQLPAMSDAGQLMEKDVASCSMPAGSVLGAAPPSEAETTGDLTSPELSCASPDPAVEMPEQQPQATAAL
ncbi:conserved hypothetical protein [Neospora caninum Liverpool]|nr:conserved hypothetical protein [Neospora caninum Liverpool]CBZ51968.1 conserved hypothetical protein [Neospora caninum Liverpool]|eukprot:XP_003882001.1 conserved hypothetical protein [Neospora caninum Liverpool]